MAEDRDGERRRKSTSTDAADQKPRRKRQAPEFGPALRSVYQRTVDEDIPSEMRDLLDKLD